MKCSFSKNMMTSHWCLKPAGTESSSPTACSSLKGVYLDLPSPTYCLSHASCTGCQSCRWATWLWQPAMGSPGLGMSPGLASEVCFELPGSFFLNFKRDKEELSLRINAEKSMMSKISKF